MKLNLVCFAIGLCAIVPFAAFGQAAQPAATLPSLNSSIVWEAGVAFTETTDQPSRQFYARLKAFATERLAIGLHGAMFQRKTMENFNQDASLPQLGYGEIGLVTAYNLVANKRFLLSAEAVTGYATATVADRAIKETRQVANEYGNDTEFEVPKVVARNNYFHLKPELTATYRIGRYLGVQASGGYNFLMGKSRFLRSNDFDGLTARVGMVLIIPTNGIP
jgi:hypothetical protein